MTSPAATFEAGSTDAAPRLQAQRLEHGLRIRDQVSQSDEHDWESRWSRCIEPRIIEAGVEPAPQARWQFRRDFRLESAYFRLKRRHLLVLPSLAHVRRLK